MWKSNFLSRIVYGSTQFSWIRILIISVAGPGCLFRIPDPNFSIPGQKDSGSASKNLQILGNMIRDVHPRSRNHIFIFYPSRNPDPGVKKASDPGSATLLIITLYPWPRNFACPKIIVDEAARVKKTLKQETYMINETMQAHSTYIGKKPMRERNR